MLHPQIKPIRVQRLERGVWTAKFELDNSGIFATAESQVKAIQKLLQNHDK